MLFRTRAPRFAANMPMYVYRLVRSAIRHAVRPHRPWTVAHSEDWLISSPGPTRSRLFSLHFLRRTVCSPPDLAVSAESNERPHTFHIYQLSFSFPNILYQASAGVEPPRTESPLATRSLQRLRLVWCAAFANDRLRRRPSGGHGSMIVTMRHVHSKPNDQ